MIVVIILISITTFILLLITDFKMGQISHKKTGNPINIVKTHGQYELFSNGLTLFEAFFQDIAEAKVRVDISFFLIDQDEISRKFLDILKKKAQEGVPVHLLGDRLGCYLINKKTRNELKEAGVHFAFAEKPRFPYFFYHLNRRNHRKIAVIDGKAAYIGGFNVGSNYIGHNPKFGDWRDYHMRYTGAVVGKLHAVFIKDWYASTGKKLTPINTKHAEGKKVCVIDSDGIGVAEEFNRLIQSAAKEIIVGTPYFIPTPELLQSFKTSLKNGIELYIMVPMKSDHPFVKEAGIFFLNELYQRGAHIKFFDAGFYHSKVFIVDGEFADIGTANFDRRSFFLNKEVNTYVYDKTFIAAVRKDYFQDMKDAVSFDESWLNNRSLSTRINEKIAAMLRPLL
ncbi:cardiolipin synthase [Halobacillus alkaliphilus]|uniref:Cardiolipin synthase n=1 Tax=Halobacillus alkaliphilus TaxID=396056 RepID=A0A1I2LER6_9BACI|nr:cardiolipin synthase [Halobacillus alkaliphilus]SFF75641.1 cardiolipin synthase [Halobacillus alkaliphilus]